MKKNLFALLLVAVVGLAGVGPALAQSDAALVKVSFPFIAGQRLLPAGSYRITADPYDPSLLLIASTASADSVYVPTGASEPITQTGSQVHAAFRNIDGHYFLWKIEMPDGNARQLTMTKAEAERTLARLNLSPAERADTAK